MPCSIPPQSNHYVYDPTSPILMNSLNLLEPNQNESQDTKMSDFSHTTEDILIQPTGPYGNNFVAPIAVMTSDLHISTSKTGINSFSPQVNATQEDFYSERFALSPVIWTRLPAEDHYSERFALSPVGHGSSLVENHYTDSSSSDDDYPERFALSPVDDGTEQGDHRYNDKAPSDDPRSQPISSTVKETCTVDTLTAQDKINAANSRKTAGESVPSEPKLRRSSRTTKKVNYNLEHHSEDGTDFE